MEDLRSNEHRKPSARAVNDGVPRSVQPFVYALRDGKVPASLLPRELREQMQSVPTDF